RSRSPEASLFPLLAERFSRQDRTDFAGPPPAEPSGRPERECPADAGPMPPRRRGAPRRSQEIVVSREVEGTSERIWSFRPRVDDRTPRAYRWRALRGV